MSYPSMRKVYQLLGDEYRFEISFEHDAIDCLQICYFDGESDFSTLNMSFSSAEAALLAQAITGLLREQV